MSTAEESVNFIGSLLEKNVDKTFKANFIICDTHNAWLMSCASKYWAAEKIQKNQRIPRGLTVTTAIDKSSAELKEKLIDDNLWNGEGDLNFASCFKSTPHLQSWVGVEPDLNGDQTFSVVNMFDVLRQAVDPKTCRSSCVSVLNRNGISSHWFTGTPNASESVFKPFIFSPNPKISPLTMINNEAGESLLHKLHSQRKPSALDDLKALEISCVDEVNAYLNDHSIPDEELDELMKDCVEAEVKFYR